MSNLPFPSDHSLQELGRERYKDLLREAEQERLLRAQKPDAGRLVSHEIFRVAQALAAIVLGVFRS